jgi:hypothetical protein
MPFYVAAWSESQDTAAALTAMAAVEDDVLTATGDRITIPRAMSLFGACAIGSDITRAQLRAPSLPEALNMDITPVARGADTPGNPAIASFFLDQPIPVAEDERIEAWVAEDVAGADRETVLAWLLEDAIVPPPAGDIFTVRVTGVTALVAFTWVRGALTFDQHLPVGNYAIVGARFESATGIAFRLEMPGDISRPGGLMRTTAAQLDPEGHRKGKWGVWTTFRHNTPPQVQWMAGAADAAETGFLDLVKIA